MSLTPAASDIPEYSEFAKQVLDIFHLDSVDVIFFFEDEGYESVYEKLISRMFPQLRSVAVICLGGKTKCVAKAKETPKSNRKIPYIFILDKDFDDLLNGVELIPNVYYLQKFSIENYLVDLPALSLASPFLLKPTDTVRFLPLGNWNGTPGTLVTMVLNTTLASASPVALAVRIANDSTLPGITSVRSTAKRGPSASA